MPESKLNSFNLGSLGVNVDKSPLHLDDGELVQAQNATRDQHGYDGALRKRPGLVKYHSGAAAGSIPGFIGAPLGPGPGATSDDATTYYLADGTSVVSKSTDSFATTTTASFNFGNPVGLTCATLNGRLYYIISPNIIHVFDGVKDSIFCTLPSTYVTATSIFALNGLLYVAARDGTTSSWALELDSVGRVRQVGATIPSSYLINSLTFHQNDLYAGTFKSASQGKIFRIRLSTSTETTVWTTDFTTTALTTPSITGMGMASYKSLLYVGYTSTGGPGNVYQRDNSGSYTLVDGAASSNDAQPKAFIVFGGTLYVAWQDYDGTHYLVRKTTNGTSWSTAATLDTQDAASAFYIVGTKLFLIKTTGTGYYTTDGTTWTSLVTGLSNARQAFGGFKASGVGSSFGASASFVLLQGSSSLQLLNSAGTMNTLSLPTGISLDTDRPPRFTIFDRYIVMVNTPSRPITIDADGVTRVLTPTPPPKSITLAATGGAGGLTGTYLARQTYVIKDTAGNIIAESDFSPIQETGFVAASNTLNAAGLNLSAEDITGSQIYRTTAGGSTYFSWLDVDGNVQTTSVSDDQSDASLSLTAAPTLGTCPNLSLVANWRGRLWGVDRATVDYARYSESGVMYAWPAANSIPIGRIGSDARGITAFLVRRDALGIGRRDSINQITGTSNTDFRNVVLSENIGVESQETVIVYKDVAYFLAKDGVYKWSSEGLECLSDGKVRSWFNTDTYFNRGRFQYAFASIDPIQNTYRLFLAAAGSSSEDRWVEYNIGTDTWWGPHKTGAFTLASAGWSTDTNDRLLPLVGSTSGFLWKDQATRTDNTGTAIDFDVYTKYHSMDTPDIEKYWGQPTFFGVVQAAGDLSITPFLGSVAAAADTTFTWDLTLSRQRLRRIGVGKHLQFRLRENTAGQDVIITGYEVPNFEVGRR